MLLQTEVLRAPNPSSNDLLRRPLALACIKKNVNETVSMLVTHILQKLRIRMFALVAVIFAYL